MDKSRHQADFRIEARTMWITLLAAFVGIAGALTAAALTRLIGLFTNLFFFHHFSFSFGPDYPNRLGLGVLAVPVIGALLIGLMARYGSEKIRGHGIPEAMEAILLKRSVIDPKIALLKPLSAAISIGTGGPFGAEGPIIMTGGSLGSVFGQLLRISAFERKTLLLAGAAAGMSATFNAPVAAVFFVVELLAFEMRPRTVMPIAVASGIAAFIRYALLHDAAPLFPSSAAPHSMTLGLIAALLFGPVGAALAYVLTKAIYGMEDLFGRLPFHWMWWPAVGAVAIGAGGLLVPQALGVGYDLIAGITAGTLGERLALALLLVKTVIWVVALGSGTSGGILAPLLIIGGSFGEVLGTVLHAPVPAVWGILGMAAAFSGVTRSPFTAVMFTFELTRDASMLLPTIIACALSAGISAIILPRSILTEKIARRSHSVDRDYVVDTAVLKPVSEAASFPVVTLSAEAALSSALRLAEADRGNASAAGFPLVAADGALTGFVPLESLLQSGLRPELQGRSLGDLFSCPVLTLLAQDPLHEAVERMTVAGQETAVVVGDDGTPIGLLSQRELLRFRQREHEAEHRRMALLPSARAAGAAAALTVSAQQKSASFAADGASASAEPHPFANRDAPYDI